MDLDDENKWLKWNFKGNSKWYVSVCKDMRTQYWLVSWNSNNHSRADRAEWIMSWGVAGGSSFWTGSVLDAKGTYLGSGWVITPWAQTLQSLGTFTGACHQEIQCRLHNSDIESIVNIFVLCYGSLINSDVCEKLCLIFIIELRDFS